MAIHAFGKLSYDAQAAAVTEQTKYDIASLTKVVATTTLVAKLVEGDFAVPLDLDARIDRYLPEWTATPQQNEKQKEWRSKVTVRHLLTHTSGLPAFKEYWRTSKGKQDTLGRIFAEPLEYEPGTKEIYSDLGIILMAEIVERLTGRTLDDLTKTYIFDPLQMSNTMYRPPKKLWPQIAPTEVDNNLRHRLVQGEVHDENAFAIGGVSGHAGLFSTAPDLAAFCQMLLNGGSYAHQRILRRATVAQFTTPQQLSSGTRTLGWAVPTEGGSSGHFFSAHSFGQQDSRGHPSGLILTVNFLWCCSPIASIQREKIRKLPRFAPRFTTRDGSAQAGGTCPRFQINNFGIIIGRRRAAPSLERLVADRLACRGRANNIRRHETRQSFLRRRPDANRNR